MTIEVKEPELEVLIQERLKSDSFESVEAMLLDILLSVPRTKQTSSELASRKKNLAELFVESPFRGLAMEFERFPGVMSPTKAQ